MVSTAVLSGILLYAQLPAALLLGAAFSAIAFAASGRKSDIPRPAFVAAQSVIGLLMAHAVHWEYLGRIADQWPVFLFGIFSVIVVSYLIGYALARSHILPGSTALWGASPGSASTMVLLSESFDADQRLVAFMSYMRVMVVAALTTLVGHIYTTGVAPPIWQTMQASGSMTQMIVALIGAFLAGHFIRLPSAPMLISLMISILIQAITGHPAALPLWLLAPSYAVLGWTIGGRFTRASIQHAWRALPAVLVANLSLIGGCALIAWPVAKLTHSGYLAAYLATSPGGSDSVAVIAMSLPVDRGFVMTMQIIRLFAVLIFGPPLAMGLARLLPRPGDRWSHHQL